MHNGIHILFTAAWHIPLQARSRYIDVQNYPLLMAIWEYPFRHALAILMCLTLLNSFNHMKSFTMFIFSWLKFVKKRGTSIYLLRVYVMPSILCIHCTFLLWHCLKLWRIDWNRTADDSTLRKPLLSLGA